jgi:hypothetical protein
MHLYGLARTETEHPPSTAWLHVACSVDLFHLARNYAPLTLYFCTNGGGHGALEVRALCPRITGATVPPLFESPTVSRRDFGGHIQ